MSSISNSRSSSSSVSPSSSCSEADLSSSERPPSEDCSPSSDPSSDFFANQSLTLLFGRISLLFAFSLANGVDPPPDFAGFLREVEADVVVDGMMGT